MSNGDQLRGGGRSMSSGKGNVAIDYISLFCLLDLSLCSTRINHSWGEGFEGLFLQHSPTSVVYPGRVEREVGMVELIHICYSEPKHPGDGNHDLRPLVLGNDGIRSGGRGCGFYNFNPDLPEIHPGRVDNLCSGDKHKLLGSDFYGVSNDVFFFAVYKC